MIGLIIIIAKFICWTQKETTLVFSGGLLIVLTPTKEKKEYAPIQSDSSKEQAPIYLLMALTLLGRNARGSMRLKKP